MSDTPKAFHTFRHKRKRYLAVVSAGNFHIVDNDGNNYGAWLTIANFQKAINAAPERCALGKARIAVAVDIIS